MAIDTEHPRFVAMKPDWQRMRDVLLGQSAMQSVGRNYIRRPDGMTDHAAWSRYVEAAPFFEATLRTHEGLTGLAFYRDPEITVPPALKPFVDDATQDGVPLAQFIEATFEEVLATARVGVLVDYPPPDPAIKSRLDEERAGRRPFLRRYATEEIFNWAVGKVKGAIVLTQVRLHEVETEQLEGDEFSSRWRRRIRVLELKLINDQWVYRQRVFVHRVWETEDGSPANPEVSGEGARVVPAPTPTTEKAQEWTEEAIYIPTIDGKPLDFIPFWIINPTDQSPAVKRPPSLGLANTNIAHFNTTGQLENVLYWHGNPQPYVAGVDPNEQTTLTIGSSNAWLFKDPNTKPGFLKLEADGVQALEKRLDRFEQHMALLGARMLSADKKGVEAADTARIHRQGEVSVLAGICGSVSRSMTDILRVVCMWQLAESNEARVKIQTAFFDLAISLDDALKAMKLWQANVISIDDLIALLKKGEIVAAERTVEEIVSQNQTSPIQPIMPGLTDSSQGGGGPPGSGDPPPPAHPPTASTRRVRGLS